MSKTIPNQLINESSPYLLQHAHNPVNWVPWGENALALAKETDRLMIISIGYSACHWCHVMEKESFGDDEIAAIMNEHFISVKVDREERPDVDQVYMQAAYVITGSGGWPLNVIALPDGRPVYAGTYFPKDKWSQILEYFATLHQSQPDLLLKQAESIKGEMDPAISGPKLDEELAFKWQDINKLQEGILSRMDPGAGGMYGAPKFPMPGIHEFLLSHYAFTGEKESLDMVTKSLDAMAAGGIYDQLGGGFCRYSTDTKWHVPHFEKMLYDNAQLIKLYSNAFKITANENYEFVIRESIAFACRELMSPEGGFYAALDADSEGEEGRFYVWSKEETDSLVSRQAPVINTFYNITGEGNWEAGKNIFFRDPSDSFAPAEELISSEEFSALRRLMMDTRSKRIRPRLDDKILTSWNALMISGLIEAYRALGDDEYLSLAIKNAEFLERNLMTRDYLLYRTYKNGQSRIYGFLDDYAFLSNAFIQLYSVSFNEHWLGLAKGLASYAVEHFYDSIKNQFYYTADTNPQLIFRPAEFSDNVIPSSTSVIVSVLDSLSVYFNEPEYHTIVGNSLSRMKPQMLKNPAFHSAWSALAIRQVTPGIELIILGPEADKLRKEIDKQYFPAIMISGGKKGGTLSHFQYKYIEGQTLIYICSGGSCQKPLDNTEEAIATITSMVKKKNNRAIPDN